MRSTVSHGAISSPSNRAYTCTSSQSILHSLRMAIASSIPPRNACALPNTCIVTHGRWRSLRSTSRARTKYLSELALPHPLDGEMEDGGIEALLPGHCWKISRSARARPREGGHDGVAARQSEPAGHVVEPPAADLGRIR